MKNTKIYYSEQLQLELSVDEYYEAIQGLIDKGLVKKVVSDSEISYELTDIGYEIGSHLGSDPINQN